MNKIVIFSDGSSRGNPGPGGWGVIVVLKDNVTELGGKEIHTTNNRMELLGAIKALSFIKKNKNEIIFYTDSSYVIEGITKWIYGWQKNNWKNSAKEDVANRDLWEKLIKVSKSKKIKWIHIGGHIGISGNERCDEIATSFADNTKIKLFKGKVLNYGINISNIKGSNVKGGTKTHNTEKAYSYLSLVHGVLHIDKTWAECEKRVKGVKGDVKFKKATSPDEEKEILKMWGVKKTDDSKFYATMF